MNIGIVGRKSGMTRVFDETGASVPVTVIEAQPNRVTQVKTEANDGYHALQVTKGQKKNLRVSKALAGHVAKLAVDVGDGFWEFRVDDGDVDPDNCPEALTLEQFSVGQIVDVSGTSKGKGFQGTIKRWNFKGQDNSHGNSLSHRAGGAIGQCQTPGRVFKGKKMAGQMGNAKVTVQNLTVVRVDSDRQLLLVKGAVPGPTGGNVIVRPAVKATQRASQPEAGSEAAQ